MVENKLFVGNIEYGATEDELKDFFTAAGEVVSAKIITDRMSGRSKGFGFVEMASADAAQAAIDTLNEKEFRDRPLHVSQARPPRQQDE